VVGRQVKVAGAARNGAALPDAHQKFTGFQFVGNLAIDGTYVSDMGVNTVDQTGKLCVVDVRILLVPLQAGGVPLKFLENLGFKIGIAEKLKDLQYSGEGGTAVPF
jgi:hypothetical protein